ncbi:hypothetical protein HN873_015335, partial [Arachis hypogaea]
ALTTILINSESEKESTYEDSSETEDYFIQQLDLMSEEEISGENINQKWFTTITLIIGEEKYDFIAFVDSGADVNCIQEGLIPKKYYEKTIEKVYKAKNDRMTIDYKLTKAKIYKNRVSLFTTFFLARNISHQVILENSFTILLYHFNVDIDGITCLHIPNHSVHFEFITKPKQHDSIFSNIYLPKLIL